MAKASPILEDSIPISTPSKMTTIKIKSVQTGAKLAAKSGSAQQDKSAFGKSVFSDVKNRALTLSPLKKR